MNGAGAGTTTHEVPGSAWVLGWACLAGQVASLFQRGPTDVLSALISVPLSALVVAWVSSGVLRARTVRTCLAVILLLLMALAFVVGALGGLTAAPADDGRSGFHIRVGL